MVQQRQQYLYNRARVFRWSYHQARSDWFRIGARNISTDKIKAPNFSTNKIKAPNFSTNKSEARKFATNQSRILMLQVGMINAMDGATHNIHISYLHG